MPLQYKIPGYAGNAFLLLIGVVMLFQQNLAIGLLIGGLGALNLYLVHKLDIYCRPEEELAHELQMTKLQEEVIEAHKRVGALEAAASPTAKSGPAPGAAPGQPTSQS